MAVAGLLIAGLLGLGAFCLALAFGDVLRQLTESVLSVRDMSPLQGLSEEQHDRTRPFDPFGLDHIPWEVMCLALAAAGVGLTAHLFWERNPYLAFSGLAAGCIPWLVRLCLLRRAQRRVTRSVRSFVRTLTALLPVYGSLYPVLRAMSTGEAGVAEQRLRQHLTTTKSAIDVVDALAADLRSPTLEALAQRLRWASQGVDESSGGLTDLLEDIEQETRRAAEQTVSRASVRLLIPMLITMVPPIVALVVYPAAGRLIPLIAELGPGLGW